MSKKYCESPCAKATAFVMLMLGLTALENCAHAQLPPPHPVRERMPIDGEFYPDSSIDMVRSLREGIVAPSFDELSPARVTASPGVSESAVHSTMYAFGNGCTAWFLAPTETMSELSMKWEGEACNGQPVEGKGKLLIRRKLRGTFNNFIAIGVFEGKFYKGGMHWGKKTNYVLTEAGKLVEDTHIFTGSFIQGVIASGSVRWVGPVNKSPNAWIKRGTFKDGTPTGKITIGRLHPDDAVEADMFGLLVDEAGVEKVDQSGTNSGDGATGSMYLRKDKTRWNVSRLTVWRDRPEAAYFERADAETSHILGTSCPLWDIRSYVMHCDSGFLDIFDTSYNRYIRLEKQPFSIPLPFSEKDMPFTRQKAG